MPSPSQDKTHYHALIMAGGIGERFWPWSRRKSPKQLLPLITKKTMIENTVERLLPMIPRERIWIITNAEQAKAMSRLMPKFLKSNFIVEPVGRDSAGAVMLGCSMIAKKDPLAVTALLPADHFIKDRKSYLKVLKSCFEVASQEPVLMTIGIKPREPSSAYGYIERSSRLQVSSSTPIFQVRRFLEKPNRKKAERLIRSKYFYWNAGMFVWSASAIYEAFQKFSPLHANGWDAIQKDSQKYLRKSFFDLPKTSIDYAVMERAKNICIAEGNFDWDDLGSWTALYDHLPTDAFGNCAQSETLVLDSRNCLVLGDSKKIVLLGIKDLIIVQTKDATLICHRDVSQRVKEAVKRLPITLL
jgi:mannose-1-phosphate guanylyltransferase